MSSHLRAGDPVRISPEFDKQVYTERGRVGIVTRVWRDPRGIDRIDVAFPGGPSIAGAYATHCELA
jgi:hypothetical protein